MPSVRKSRKKSKLGPELISVQQMSKPQSFIFYDEDTRKKVEKQGVEAIAEMVDKEILKDVMKIRDKTTLNKHFDYIISKSIELDAENIVAYLIVLSNKLNINPEVLCESFAKYWQSKMDQKKL